MMTRRWSHVTVAGDVATNVSASNKASFKGSVITFGNRPLLSKVGVICDDMVTNISPGSKLVYVSPTGG